MTTTTDIAVIPDADVEVVEPLTKPQAKALDKKIRSASDKLGTATDNLLDLLEQAAAGQIHEALGIKSWTLWFKDAVRVQVSDKYERKELVKLMSGKGMSQRAIAGSLGVSQMTVNRDLEGEQFDTDTVTSLDGAERPRNGKAKDVEQDYIEGEVVEEVEGDEDTAPTPAVEIVSIFNDETANLWGAASELGELVALEKWAGARKRVAKANLNTLKEIISGLTAIVDDLMEA